MAKIIAIANQKGGVGKTTTAINLSSSLSHFGKKVLLIDMDPQGNAGRGLGININAQDRTIYEVLLGRYDLTQAIQSTKFDSLDLIPSNLSLAKFEAEKGYGEQPFYGLKKALEKLPSHYDYVILDCPPSLGILCLNCLCACTSVLIPVQCEYFAMEAVASIISTISRVQNSYNPKMKIEGFLLTMYSANTSLGTEVMRQVRGTFKENTFLTYIPRNQSIADSQGKQMPVTLFRPTSAGALSYLSLAREILEHEQK